MNKFHHYEMMIEKKWKVEGMFLRLKLSSSHLRIGPVDWTQSSVLSFGIFESGSFFPFYLITRRGIGGSMFWLKIIIAGCRGFDRGYIYPLFNLQGFPNGHNRVESKRPGSHWHYNSSSFDPSQRPSTSEIRRVKPTRDS